MHTATVSQELTVLTPTLTERLAKVTRASRKLATMGVKITGQNLGAADRPVLFIAEPPPREAGLRISKSTKCKDQRRVMVSQFDDIDVAWPAECKA